ncbi:hypothetical protein [Acetobacter conturbans]|uniref:Uncharacterized protein n=1 Tax=Acetobacter conturbans TaxID=1737472 RepID=A0ABX0JYX5_9PROT|nr:hypothetical protein [Acetobacter conturbans]NHN87258.1 hypothetical protein [Acetobacter conturbans]
MNARLFPALAVAACGISLLVQSPVQAADHTKTAQSTAKTPIRPASFLSGSWSSMGMAPVTIVANRAAGPASRIILHLPHELQKSGQETFSLAHTTGNVWSGTEKETTVTFRLESDNFGVLTMNDSKPGHHLEMPLSRF